MLAPLWSSWGWDRLVCPGTPGLVHLQLVKTEGDCTLICLVIIGLLERGS